jgi:ribosomal protein S27AE
MTKYSKYIFKRLKNPVCDNCNIDMHSEFGGKWICSRCGYTTRWRYKNIISIKGMIAATIVIILVVTFINISTSYSERNKLHNMILQVNHLATECKIYSSENIAVYGKCLVWDGSYSQINSMIPKNIRASSSDKTITIFLVLPRKDIALGKYSISKETAYIQYVDICAIVWPNNKILGTHTIISKDPRASRPVKNEPEYGNPNEPIAAWIRTLKTYQ